MHPSLRIDLILMIFGLNLFARCEAQMTVPPQKTLSQVQYMAESQPIHNTLRQIDAHQTQLMLKNAHAASKNAAGFLLADQTDLRLNLSDPVDAKLSDILNRNGPDMRPSRGYKDFPDISLDVAIRAWQLLHEHSAIAVENRVRLVRPAIEEVLTSASVSEACHKSVGELFEGAIRMESWALKMLNSWGNFPSIGLFEGTYTEMGSFHTCVNIPQNDIIDHSHFCFINYKPVLPTRPDYELVLMKEASKLLNMSFAHSASSEVYTSSPGMPSKPSLQAPRVKLRDAFTDILEHAHYHHYVYYKVGTCWPIKCSPVDVRRVIKLLGRRNILMTGPVKCYSKYSEDYEEEYDSIEPLHDQSANNVTNQSSSGNATSAVGAKTNKKKLAISMWDVNKGVYVWKPYFSKTQKGALTVLLVITAIICLMTLIDLLIVRIPRVCRLLKASLCNNESIWAEPQFAPSIPIGSLYDNHEFSNSNNKSLQPWLGTDVPRASATTTSCDNNLESLPPSAEYRQVSLETSLNHNNLNDTHSSIVHSLNRPVTTVVSQGNKKRRELTGIMSWVDDFSIITNLGTFLRVTQSQMKNDIACLNGIRCLTMAWILLSHTMMYNEWSAFGRTRQIEDSIKSVLSQPLFNGSYLVDTFFLMSGLLSAFTAFRHCQGMKSKFNAFVYIFGRWLRLTPQIFVISMVFILMPALSIGPNWNQTTAEYAENCVDNWWINVLHLQAFYKTDKMCNYVTWWISIDFFYHLFAVVIIWVTLIGNHAYGFASIALIVISHVGWEAYRHFQWGLPPNILSTIPQTGAMWTDMTLNFFWTPATHAVPFFFGFYLGYLFAMKRKVIQKLLNPRRAAIGWLLSTSLLVVQSFSTYWWVIGAAQYTKLEATLFYVICPIIWTASISWIIVACHHGYGGFVNRVLSLKVFIVLGKASYLVYLSHFQVLFLYFGNQSLLLEPTPFLMIYMIIGNIFVATLYGVFLCIVYEIPWLKVNRRLMKYL